MQTFLSLSTPNKLTKIQRMRHTSRKTARRPSKPERIVHAAPGGMPLLGELDSSLGHDGGCRELDGAALGILAARHGLRCLSVLYSPLGGGKVEVEVVEVLREARYEE